MHIERLGEDGWTRLRDVRLTALRTDPDAFGSNLAREEGFGERHWRMRLRSGPWFVAVRDGQDVGLVSGLAEPGGAEDDRHVMALWVRPDARRGGAGTALLGATAEWARAEGAATLSLWTVADGTAARELYRACGFAPTGASMPLARDPSRQEERWARRL